MSGNGAGVRTRITVLGSGTSVGVPTIGCDCAVCTSTDPRDKRLRPSVLISRAGKNVVIDTTPDFRQQVLRCRLDRVDAILYTHSHADHILGLDDVRPFNYHQREPIPIFGSADTLACLRRAFSYIFAGVVSESSMPKVEAHEFGRDPVQAAGLEFEPLRLEHGSGTSFGFRFGNAAYLTDHSGIPEETMQRLTGLDVLFLDALRYKPHPTHSTVERSLGWVERLAPRRAFFTHICHDISHAELEATLPPHVRLAYDGLEIEVEDTAQ